MGIPNKTPPSAGKNLLKGFKSVKLTFLKVNLLINKEQQVKLHLKFLKWILTSGRYLVIIVELITISAFVYRYKLDADLIALKEKIEAKIPYVEGLKSDETLIRQTQFQLSAIKKIKAENPNHAAILTRIAQLTPQNIKLTSININQTQTMTGSGMAISGHTPSTADLSAFVKALQSDNNFSDIKLSNISFEGDITFSISGSLALKGGKSS